MDFSFDILIVNTVWIIFSPFVTIAYFIGVANLNKIPDDPESIFTIASVCMHEINDAD